MRVRIDLTMNAAKNLRQDGVCWEDTGRTARSPFVTAWQELTQVFGRSSRSGTHSPRFSGKKWRRCASNLHHGTMCRLSIRRIPDCRTRKMRKTEQHIRLERALRPKRICYFTLFDASNCLDMTCRSQGQPVIRRKSNEYSPRNEKGVLREYGPQLQQSKTVLMRRGRVSSMIDRNSRTESVKTSQRHCTQVPLCLLSRRRASCGTGSSEG